MKKRILVMLICLCMVVCMLPTNVYAYVGALTETSSGTVRTGTETVEGTEMFYLENDYIHFSIDKTYGIVSYTLPTRLKNESYKDHGMQYTSFTVQYPTQSEKTMTVQSSKVTQDGKSIKVSYDFIGDYYKKTNDADITYDVTYRLVKLDRGAVNNAVTDQLIKYDKDDNGTTWGVIAEGIFKYNGPGIDDFKKDGANTMTDNYRGVVARCSTDYMGFPSMGHASQVNKKPDAGIFLSKAVYYNSDMKNHHSSTNVSEGLSLTGTNNGSTYITEIYSNSYTWANPFVATSGFGQYSYSSGGSWGIEGFPNWPNLPAYVKYSPKSVAAISEVVTISEAPGLDFAYENKLEASRLWGYRDLCTLNESLDPTEADKVNILESADKLAVFSKNGGYTAEPAESTDKLEALEKTYGTPVAVLRGNFTSTNGTSYTFTDGAVALSPTITATWGDGGEFTVSKDGTITHKGVNLNAPTFKFYQPAKSAKDEELTFNFTGEGLEIGMIPANNSAVVYINIPYATTALSSATVTPDGNLVFNGTIRIGTIFDGAEFNMEQLGYGMSGSEFKVNGIEANGKISTADLFNMELAEIEGEINTFKGQEKYSFSLELNAFDLFEAEAELELKRCKSNGVLMPNNLYFAVNQKVGIPLVPPVVIGQLNGGGAGFYGLADTVNGDFLAIPPIALRGTVTGTYLHLVEGTGDIVLGPSRVELAGKNINFVGAPNGANILDEFGYKFFLNGLVQNYKGTDYTGLAFGGSKYFKVVLPKKDLDIIKINSSIGASAFGGLDNVTNPKNLYLKVNANGKIEGIVHIPENVPVLGGIKVLGAQLDAIMGGQTVIPIRNVTIEEGAKQAFENIDVYLGIATTASIIGSDFRVWVILPDVVKPKKNVNWGTEFSIWSSLDEWDWNKVINNRSVLRSSLQSEPLLLAAPMQANEPVLLSLSPSEITLDSIGAEEQAYLALAFDESVTEDEIKNALTIKNISEDKDLTPEWLATDEDGNITNGETANTTSEILFNTTDNMNHRLVIVHVGGSEVSQNKFKVSAGDLEFTWEQTKTQPFEKLNLSLDTVAVTVKGSVKYPVSGATYILRTYLAKEKGGDDYLIDEREITNTSDINVSIPTDGVLAPSGSYYVSTFLSEEKTGDWDDDISTPETKALLQIDSAAFDDTISYTNNNQPDAPASVTLSAIGNEVMKATWSEVTDAEKYKIVIYKKDDSSNWIDSGYGYELDTSDLNDMPAGVTYDAANGYSFNMALTVGGTAKDGSGTLLAAGKDYKIAVQACKTADDVQYYSEETLSNEENLPEYKPLDMKIAIDGNTLAADSDTQVYNGYVNRNGAKLTVSADNATFEVKKMDGTSITPSDGSYTIPDFEGTLMLEVIGSVTNGSLTDITKSYVLIYKDDIAPIISLDKPIFSANAQTGSFTVSGITEPGATVDYGDTDEAGYPVTVKAGDNGKFTINGSLKQNGSEPLQSKMLIVTAADTNGNTSAPVVALVDLQEQNYNYTSTTTDITTKDIGKASITGISDKNYTGKDIIQSELNVKYGTTDLTEETDYTVTYKNNKNIGTATITITGKGAYTGTVTKTFKITATKGNTYTVSYMKYKVTKVATGGSGTVTLTGTTKSKSKLTSLTIGSTVKLGGKTYKITAIGNKAFKSYTKLKKATIGSNITSIGKEAFSGCSALTSVTIKTGVKKIGSKAFYNCKKLSKITIKSTKLTSVGSKAITNIKKNAIIDAPSKKVTAYKKLFKSSTGYKKTMKIK